MQRFVSILFLFGLLLTFPAVTNAQDEKKALAILDAMSKRYQTYASYQASFTYSAGTGRPAVGEAIVKGQKFKLRMADQEILTDGKVMATFMKESNEVTIQDYDAEELGDLSPTRIYLAYKKGYKNSFLGETKSNGRTYENIRLTPVASNSQISKVELKIDKEDKSIKGWKIYSKGSEATSFEITEFKTGISLPDSGFTFAPKNYPGAEVIDLR
jgi:outer membrane lipoprotein-sorting protein